MKGTVSEGTTGIVIIMKKCKQKELRMTRSHFLKETLIIFLSVKGDNNNK